MIDLDDHDDDLAKEPLAADLRRLVPELSPSRADEVFRRRRARSRRLRAARLASVAAAAGLVLGGVLVATGQRGQDITVAGPDVSTTVVSVADAIGSDALPPAGGGLPTDPFACAGPLTRYWAATTSIAGAPVTAPPSQPTFAAEQAVRDQYRGPDAAELELRAAATMAPTYGSVDGLIAGAIVVRFDLLSNGPGLVIAGFTVCPDGRWPVGSIETHPTKGPMPHDVAGPDGMVDWTKLPQFLSIARTDGVEGVVGYARALDLVSTPNQPVPPSTNTAVDVYADDLTTLIGHLYPGIGFVPLGVDPASVPATPVTTAGGSAVTTDTIGTGAMSNSNRVAGPAYAAEIVGKQFIVDATIGPDGQVRAVDDAIPLMFEATRITVGCAILEGTYEPRPAGRLGTTSMTVDGTGCSPDDAAALLAAAMQRISFSFDGSQLVMRTDQGAEVALRPAPDQPAG